MYENKVVEVLKKNRIDFLTTLPCDKIKNLLDVIYADHYFKRVSLNKEEDGVGICAGAYLAGARPAMVIQSSGLGNCFNSLLSLTVTYKLPLPIITSWRGIYNEEITAQIPFNKDLPRGLEAWYIPYKIIENPNQIDLLDEVINVAYKNNKSYVGLISPKFWENEKEEILERQFPKRGHKSVLKYESEIIEPEMTRYEAIKVIAEHLDGEVVVSNIGIPSKELYAIKDRDLNFYMMGSFTQASSIGLGLALKTERKTIVLDGDGSLLGTSVLSVIGTEKPKNLFIICLDNGTHGSTGDQFTSAYHQIDMELYARAIGIEKTAKAQNKEELTKTLDSLDEGPKFIHIIVKSGNAKVKNIPLEPVEIKNRFMKALNST